MPVRWVVVLGGGISGWPAPYQLSETTTARLLEGIRIHRALPGSRIILSGGSSVYELSEAEAMMETAKLLGVKDGEVLLESKSLDTEEQARIIKQLVKGEQIILVTSAMHMPRSMGLFKKAGLNPIAAPADFQCRLPKNDPRRFLPRASELEKSSDAAHEYLGLAWAKVRGKI